MKRNKLALSCLLMVTGFFGACTDMAEDDFQNNKYPVELMAEKADMTFTRAIGEKTSWNGERKYLFMMALRRNYMRFRLPRK